ncbi:MaoC family dehydratase [Saccharopolyspora dendranthemae]|uniref:Acyl dehydratase n=1 Tax=Saccharopolyspora dendranthemae TaxID=1181886 RepID=A0A561U6K0_9PSEU|nr:MaoC family dehydratase [Saccharopolyspora dendranthemae]TWF94994.1 acyl dehydratase [Saccharopolyspora dendranthemae]
MNVKLSEIAVGDQLPPLSVPLERSDLVRYAGASGDFNPIHWNQRFAEDVGLPDVIAHGMLTMAVAGRLVSEWTGDPGAIVRYGVRFTRPVVVPDDADGALVTLSGKVAKINDDGTVKISITASAADQSVLGGASATVRLPE